MNRLSMVLFVVLSVALVTGCSRREREWEGARSADTLEAYQGFLKNFTEGEFTDQAKARVRELEEARDWQEALAADNSEGYQKFVARYPDSQMSDEARIRIESFGLMKKEAEAVGAAMPPDVVPPPPPAASAATPSAAPAPAPAAVPARAPVSQPAAVKADPALTYRVQLGAFKGGEKQAMGEWRRLQQEYPQWLGKLSPSVKLATTSEGHTYRLQAGMVNEARAREICKGLKEKSEACVVVLP